MNWWILLLPCDWGTNKWHRSEGKKSKIKYNAMYYRSLQCNRGYYSALQWITVQCNINLWNGESYERLKVEARMSGIHLSTGHGTIISPLFWCSAVLYSAVLYLKRRIRLLYNTYTLSALLYNEMDNSIWPCSILQKGRKLTTKKYITDGWTQNCRTPDWTKWKTID